MRRRRLSSSSSACCLFSLTLLAGCGSDSTAKGGNGGSAGLTGVSGASAAGTSGAAAQSGLGGASAGSPGAAGSGATGGAPDAGAAGSGLGVAGASAGGSGTGGAAAGSGGAGASGGDGAGAGGMTASGLPARATIVSALRKANSYFVAKWPDPGKAIDSSHPSNIWTRSVYFEGLMSLYGVDPQASDLTYAVQWGTSHSWGLNTGTTTRSADNQCAGQTYLDLYKIDAQPVRIADIKTDLDMVVAGSKIDDWTWVDAIQMAMPAFAKLGALGTSTTYYDKMYAMYSSSKNSQGAAGFYSKTDHLWWRDANFDPPYKEPNGQSCYWSRGNGWVFAALTRVLDTIPTNESHRAEYVADLQAMAEALRAVQRSDGFWNVSLHDPTDFGGPELTGTSLFAYGMAFGVRKGFLPAATFQPVIDKAWAAMASAVHSTGFLGYVQGSGKQPSDGQPVTFDSVPDYEDFGLGCFLLGGSEVAKLAAP